MNFTPEALPSPFVDQCRSEWSWGFVPSYSLKTSRRCDHDVWQNDRKGTRAESRPEGEASFARRWHKSRRGQNMEPAQSNRNGGRYYGKRCVYLPQRLSLPCVSTRDTCPPCSLFTRVFSLVTPKASVKCADEDRMKTTLGSVRNDSSPTTWCLRGGVFSMGRLHPHLTLTLISL